MVFLFFSINIQTFSSSTEEGRCVMRKFAPQYVVMIQAAVTNHHQMMDIDLITKLLFAVAKAGNLEPAADRPMVNQLPCLDDSGDMSYTFLLPLMTSHLKMTCRVMDNHRPHVGVDTWPEDDVVLLFFHSCQPVDKDAVRQAVVQLFHPNDTIAEEHVFFK